MYAGTTLHPFKYFDAWFGTHQKIDRVARKHLASLLEGQSYYFPSARQINRFEGLNGPDGVKRKAPGVAEPRHFYDPHDAHDIAIIGMIEEHFKLLSQALQANNGTRAAFEAAWLAHALVDGLTPAHHYPYEAELVKLRGGKSIESRNTLKKQLIIPGETLPKRVRNNWKMFGDKGLLATHFAFEMGVAVIISSPRLRLSRPTEADCRLLQEKGLAGVFKLRAKEVANLNMYKTFYKSGWTPQMARQVRRKLLPIITTMVTLAWYEAVLDSQAHLQRAENREQ